MIQSQESRSPASVSDREFDNFIGFRAPSMDSEDYDAYLVVMALSFASKAGVTDRDLVDRWVIDFLLSRGDRLRPLVERTIGRPVSASEPKPFNMEAIRREQSERNRQESTALFD